MAKISSRLLSHVRLAATALALAVIVVLATPAPVLAQGGSAAVSEQQLLNNLKGGAISGRVSIPDKNAGNLINPAGREWQGFYTSTLKWVGALAILGMLALLIIFYMWRGTVRIEGGRSGRKIARFTGFERFTHWLTASTFVVLGITGLNITFGRALILPWLGPEAFTAWSEWGKIAHNYLSFAFTLGVVLMFVVWIGQNIPTSVDLEWLKRGGGMGKGHDHPPAYKFNAGQKLLYWFVVIGGAAMIISGFMLMFPFYNGLTLANMETAQIFHALVGVVFVALILAHIYIGTMGMEGAFEAMGEGAVDVNWAKEHHSLWVQEEAARGTAAPNAMARPAE
jgi:formate dehydrogenase subunit gamma